MENWIIEIIEKFGYMGILLLIALENIFPPIPSEVILTFGGFMTTTTNLSVIGVITFSTIGSVIGAIILYSIGLLIDVNRMEKIVDKWGHILRLTKKDIYNANAWFLKYGVWAVFFCRFIPLIRSLISIPAGMSRMNFSVFLLLTTLGTLIWNVTLIKIGTVVGESWESIVGYMDIYSNVVYAALVLLFILFVVVFIKKNRD
ncbi:membrane protein DedA with SNARE-associated domain [Anoxybacillus vitaminiphilus]|uniref:Membrane protein DedA with SNARE-associated domain n=1 Tax=Paranoxybacillus vitaminiphilus TaxID=581036 RepID=A0A327YCM0_9BACL|nr:DedA family protein [Anoxybacillus vitaminiphilus]RAK18594.1 membrane protein DedA with SNARE-associated domain [Anoxybacillus vitaminiphilus]